MIEIFLSCFVSKTPFPTIAQMLYSFGNCKNTNTTLYPCSLNPSRSLRRDQNRHELVMISVHAKALIQTFSSLMLVYKDTLIVTLDLPSRVQIYTDILKSTPQSTTTFYILKNNLLLNVFLLTGLINELVCSKKPILK